MARMQIALSPEAHGALVGFAGELTGMLKKRVTQSDAVLAAIKVARAHPNELPEAANAAGSAGEDTP